MTYYIELGDRSPDPYDLAGRTEVRKFIAMLRESADSFFAPDAAALARRVADQFEVQAPKPKPEEPKGLGAVVEDSKGSRWIRIDLHTGCNDWVALGARSYKPDNGENETVRYFYRNIDAVKVLSDGVPVE